MATNHTINAQIRFNLASGNVKPVVDGLQRQLNSHPLTLPVKLKIDQHAVAQLSRQNAQFRQTAQSLNALSSAATKANASLSSLGSHLRSVGAAMHGVGGGMNLNAFDTQLNNIQKSTANVGKQLNKTQKDAINFSESIGINARRFISFGAAAAILAKTSYELRNATVAAFEFDREMVRLKQVGDGTEEGISGIVKTITKLGTGLGVNSAEMAKTAVTLRQAGLSAGDTRKALDVLGKTTLSATFDDIHSTTEGLIALFNQFDNNADNLEKHFSAMSKVSADFAVESSDLVEALKRTGGAFKTAGGNVNELFAMFTTIRSHTRESAESIATGMRTILARLQDPAIAKKLRDIGVEVYDMEGKFVGPLKAIERLGAALTRLPKGNVQAASILKDIGGLRQLSRVIPLVYDQDTTRKALRSADESLGKLQSDADVAQQALLTQLSKVKEGFLDLFRTISQDSSVKLALNTIINSVRLLTDAMRELKPLVPVIVGLGALKLGQGIFQGAQSFRRGFFHPRAGYAEGGLVTGGTPGKDSVDASLMPGEYVFSKRAVDAIGRDKIHTLHRMAKGGRTYNPNSGAELVDNSFQDINKFASGGVVKNFRGMSGRTIVGRIAKEAASPKGQVFASFYDSYREANPLRGKDRTLFDEIYASQSMGALDKYVLQQSVNIYREHKDTGSVHASQYEKYLRKLGHNVPNRIKLLDQVFAGQSVTTPKLGSYLKGLQDPNYYPVDRHVVGAAHGIPTVEAVNARYTKLLAREYDLLSQFVTKAGLKVGLTGQQTQAAVYGNRAKYSPKLEDTIHILSSLRGYATGGRVSLGIPREHSVERREVARLLRGKFGREIREHIKGSKFLDMGNEAFAFKSPDGTVLRISQSTRTTRRPDHPLMLQPLSREKIGHGSESHIIEELPFTPPLDKTRPYPFKFENGREVIPPWHERRLDAFRKRVQSEGLVPTDIHTGNIAFVREPGSKAIHLKAIDPGTFSTKQQTVNRNRMDFLRALALDSRRAALPPGFARGGRVDILQRYLDKAGINIDARKIVRGVHFTRRGNDTSRGMYFPGTGIITIKDKSDVETMFHEFGHALDFTLGTKGNYGSHNTNRHHAKVATLLKKHLPEGYDQRDYYTGTPHESFAEAFALYGLNKLGVQHEYSKEIDDNPVFNRGIAHIIENKVIPRAQSIKQLNEGLYRNPDRRSATARKLRGYATGGTVPATSTHYFATGGPTVVGSDTVPAMLTPDEFVIKKDSAKRIGYKNLEYMNATGKIPVEAVEQFGVANATRVSKGFKPHTIDRMVEKYGNEGVQLLALKDEYRQRRSMSPEQIMGGMKFSGSRRAFARHQRNMFANTYKHLLYEYKHLDKNKLFGLFPKQHYSLGSSYDTGRTTKILRKIRGYARGGRVQYFAGGGRINEETGLPEYTAAEEKAKKKRYMRAAERRRKDDELLKQQSAEIALLRQQNNVEIKRRREAPRGKPVDLSGNDIRFPGEESRPIDRTLRPTIEEEARSFLRPSAPLPRSHTERVAELRIRQAERRRQQVANIPVPNRRSGVNEQNLRPAEFVPHYMHVPTRSNQVRTETGEYAGTYVEKKGFTPERTRAEVRTERAALATGRFKAHKELYGDLPDKLTETQIAQHINNDQIQENQKNIRQNAATSGIRAPRAAHSYFGGGINNQSGLDVRIAGNDVNRLLDENSKVIDELNKKVNKGFFPTFKKLLTGVKDQSKNLSPEMQFQKEQLAQNRMFKTQLAAGGLALAGSAIQEHFASRENVREGRGRVGSAIGGTIAGAGVGAGVGSAFGPWGTAIGGFLGAVVGTTSALKQFDEELSNVRLEKFSKSLEGLEFTEGGRLTATSQRKFQQGINELLPDEATLKERNSSARKYGNVLEETRKSTTASNIAATASPGFIALEQGLKAFATVKDAIVGTDNSKQNVLDTMPEQEREALSKSALGTLKQAIAQNPNASENEIQRIAEPKTPNKLGLKLGTMLTPQDQVAFHELFLESKKQASIQQKMNAIMEQLNNEFELTAKQLEEFSSTMQTSGEQFALRAQYSDVMSAPSRGQIMAAPTQGITIGSLGGPGTVAHDINEFSRQGGGYDESKKALLDIIQQVGKENMSALPEKEAAQTRAQRAADIFGETGKGGRYNELIRSSIQHVVGQEGMSGEKIRQNTGGIVDQILSPVKNVKEVGTRGNEELQRTFGQYQQRHVDILNRRREISHSEAESAMSQAQIDVLRGEFVPAEPHAARSGFRSIKPSPSVKAIISAPRNMTPEQQQERAQKAAAITTAIGKENLAVTRRQAATEAVVAKADRAQAEKLLPTYRRQGVIPQINEGVSTTPHSLTKQYKEVARKGRERGLSFSEIQQQLHELDIKNVQQYRRQQALPREPEITAKTVQAKVEQGKKLTPVERRFARNRRVVPQGTYKPSIIDIEQGPEFEERQVGTYKERGRRKGIIRGLTREDRVELRQAEEQRKAFQKGQEEISGIKGPASMDVEALHTQYKQKQQELAAKSVEFEEAKRAPAAQTYATTQKKLEILQGISPEKRTAADNKEIENLQTKLKDLFKNSDVTKLQDLSKKMAELGNESRKAVDGLENIKKNLDTTFAQRQYERARGARQADEASRANDAEMLAFGSQQDKMQLAMKENITTQALSASPEQFAMLPDEIKKMVYERLKESGGQQRAYEQFDKYGRSRGIKVEESSETIKRFASPYMQQLQNDPASRFLRNQEQVKGKQYAEALQAKQNAGTKLNEINKAQTVKDQVNNETNFELYIKGLDQAFSKQQDATRAFLEGANRLSTALEGFKDTTLKIQKEGTINVVLNGGQLLQNMKGDLEKEILQQVITKLQGEIAKQIKGQPAR